MAHLIPVDATSDTRFAASAVIIRKSGYKDDCATSLIALHTSPFWIGSAADGGVRLHLPGIAARHLALVEREDGFWALPDPAARPRPRLNGTELHRGARVVNGDRLAIGPGVEWRFADGTAHPRPPLVSTPDRAGAAVRAPRRRPWTGAVRSLRLHQAALRRAALVCVVAGLASGAIAMAIHAVAPGAAPRPIGEAEARLWDDLALHANERIEHGAALLDAGMPDAALREFAHAIDRMEASPIRERDWARPRIAATQRSIADVYRARRVAVPADYRAVSSAVGGRAVRPASWLRARLSEAEFETAVEGVQRSFEARWGRRLVVTGRDHAEHRSLYGTGSALDLRVHGLSVDQIRCAVSAFRAAGVRVKDFSDDGVLRRQVAAAIRAGYPERAGTGLHLHVDRFGDRRDAWTAP